MHCVTSTDERARGVTYLDENETSACAGLPHGRGLSRMSTLMNRPPARLGNGLAVLDVPVEEADYEVAGLLLDGIDFVASLDVCDRALVADDLLRADRAPVISVLGMVEASPPHALARALEQLVELLEQSLEVVVVAPEHEDGEVRRDRLDALQRALQVHLIVAKFLSELEVPLGARPP